MLRKLLLLSDRRRQFVLQQDEEQNTRRLAVQAHIETRTSAWSGSRRESC